MNREIKFRAWEKHLKVMYVPRALTFSTNKMVVAELRHGNEIQGEIDDILMQCTGLKDKNGKEIYEGDIIEDEVGRDPIIFQSGMFCVGKDGDESLWWFVLNSDFKVIGNIYENPELLK